MSYLWVKHTRPQSGITDAHYDDHDEDLFTCRELMADGLLCLDWTVHYSSVSVSYGAELDYDNKMNNNMFIVRYARI